MNGFQVRTTAKYKTLVLAMLPGRQSRPDHGARGKRTAESPCPYSIDHPAGPIAGRRYGRRGAIPSVKGTRQRGSSFLPVAILRGSASFWNELEVGSHNGSKGNKQRRIQFSFELRKAIVKFLTDFPRHKRASKPDFHRCPELEPAYRYGEELGLSNLQRPFSEIVHETLACDTQHPFSALV